MSDERDAWRRLKDPTPARETPRVERITPLKDGEMSLTDIPIPSDIDPADAHRPERCAYMLRRIEELGMPDLLNKSEVARLFDVSRQRIYQDLNEVVEPQIVSAVENDHKAVSQVVFRSSIKELMRDGEYEKATRVLQRWNEWLSERGHAEKAPDKIELTEAEEGLIEEMF